MVITRSTLGNYLRGAGTIPEIMDKLCAMVKTTEIRMKKNKKIWQMKEWSINSLTEIKEKGNLREK